MKSFYEDSMQIYDILRKRSLRSGISVEHAASE